MDPRNPQIGLYAVGGMGILTVPYPERNIYTLLFTERSYVYGFSLLTEIMISLIFMRLEATAIHLVTTLKGWLT